MHLSPIEDLEVQKFLYNPYHYYFQRGAHIRPCARFQSYGLFLTLTVKLKSITATIQALRRVRICSSSSWTSQAASHWPS